MLKPLSEFPAIIAYLQDVRHLKPEMIADARIGVHVDGQGKEWIGFPLEEGTKLRAAPSNDSPNKGRYLEEGTKPQLYYGEILEEGEAKMQEVIVCEGEIDCLILNQLGFNAVSSTSGAATFYESWVKRFPKDCDVTLCFDADEAGKQGREKLRSLLREQRKDIRISDVIWEEGKPKGYDVSDWYKEITCLYPDASDADIAALLKEMIRAWRSPVEGGADYKRPVAVVARPVDEVTFGEWYSFLEEEFATLAPSTEACASVIAQLLVQGVTNCFGLILVDVPSSGKTICLNFFAGLEELIYTSDDFSPASLVSHSAQKKANDLNKIDMLPKIRFKTLLIREMAAVFGDKDDELRKKMHLLTRVMDGEGLETESGVHGKRGYQGDYLFMLLGASTPIALRVWKVMGGAGHRLFFLSLNSKRIGEKQLFDIMRSGGYKAREVAVREKTHDFFRTLWSKNPEGITWDPASDDENAVRWVARLAHFVAHFRGEILVYSAWGEGDEGGGGKKELQHTRPQIEQPTRVAAMLYNLARGRAALESRNHIKCSDLGPVIRLALDTAPDPRPLVLRELIQPDFSKDNHLRCVNARTVAESMKCAVNTAKKEMEKLIVLGVAKNVKGFENVTNPTMEFDEAIEDVSSGGNGKQKEISLSEEFAWLAGDDFRELASSLGISLPTALSSTSHPTLPLS